MGFTDNTHTMQQYDSFVIKPHPLQFFVSEAIPLAFLTAGLIGAGFEGFRFRSAVLTGCVLLLLYLIVSYVELRRKTYIIGPEMIVYDRGIFDRKSDFIEMYRVIDFKERHTFLQQMVGLKTIIIYSGDRTTPKLCISGVRTSMPLVELIRGKVEYNKRLKGVYEITNR